MSQLMFANEDYPLELVETARMMLERTLSFLETNCKCERYFLRTIYSMDYGHMKEKNAGNGETEVEVLASCLVQDAFAISIYGLDENGLESYLVALWSHFLEKVKSEEFGERIDGFIFLVKEFLRSLYIQKAPDLADVSDEELTLISRFLIQNLMATALQEPEVLYHCSPLLMSLGSESVLHQDTEAEMFNALLEIFKNRPLRTQ